MKLMRKKGQGFVEYALLLALIVIVSVAAFKAMGQSASDAATKVQGELDAAVAGG
jgi:Flp pilus assembly pilin Flp